MCGLLGPASALERKSPHVSDQVRGRAGGEGGNRKPHRRSEGRTGEEEVGALLVALLPHASAPACCPLPRIPPLPQVGSATAWKLCAMPAGTTPTCVSSHPPLPAPPPPQVVGVGGTTAWKLCTMSAGTTLACVFDIVAQHGGGDAMAGAGQQFFLQAGAGLHAWGGAAWVGRMHGDGRAWLQAGAGLHGALGNAKLCGCWSNRRQCCSLPLPTNPSVVLLLLLLQFVTRYLHDSGAMRCRVTTVTRRWVLWVA